MADKIFCGSGKIIQTKFGALTKISFSKQDLEKMQANLSEKGWINLVLKEKKDKQEGKPTHYLEVDKWDGGTANAFSKPPETSGTAAPLPDNIEPLPF